MLNYVRTDGLVLGTLLGVGQDIYIGANVIGTTSANNKLNGWVDEVKVYNKALNATEISLL